MVNNVEGHSLPCISPSVVTFSSQIDENDFKSKSLWNPDWTIQREISITIDKSVNDSPSLFSKKLQILVGIIICVAFILSIIVPLMISTIDPSSSQTKRTQSTTIATTAIKSNSSTKRIEIYECGNLIYLENVNIIGYDLMSKSSMTWSTCCSWCLSVLSCRAFTYETISSKCFLKTMTDDNQLFNNGYKSAKYYS